jgi:dihydropteroate synthase
MSEFLLRIKGTIHTLSTPWVMGIINLTPDSFFAESRKNTADEAETQARQMLAEGARILDLGAYSSRPGAAHISEVEEWERLASVLPAVLKAVNEHPQTFVSIDTFRASVARKALEMGAHIINDISAGSLDPKMFETVAEFQCPYIAMHMQGTPQDMQQNPQYDHVTQEIVNYFSGLLPKLHYMGIHDTIVDVGYGFGKTIAQNYQLLREQRAFEFLGRPILSGISRKSMIYKALGTDAENSLNGTTALHMAALMGGAKILRAHDVKEAVETITLFTHLYPEGLIPILEEWER